MLSNPLSLSHGLCQVPFIVFLFQLSCALPACLSLTLALSRSLSLHFYCVHAHILNCRTVGVSHLHSPTHLLIQPCCLTHFTFLSLSLLLSSLQLHYHKPPYSPTALARPSPYTHTHTKKNTAHSALLTTATQASRQTARGRHSGRERVREKE